MSDKSYCDSPQCQWVYGCKNSRYNCPNDPNEPWTYCEDRYVAGSVQPPNCYDPI